MIASSSVARTAPASIEAEIRAGRLAPDHVEVQLDRQAVVVLGHPDVEVLALAQRDARVVVQAHEPEDGPIREAEVGQAMERDPAEAEQHVAGVDRLGDAVQRPERGPVAALAVVVLDVVVDQAEVVAQLDRGGARQRAAMVAGDRGVGEEAEQRPHALAGRAGAVQPEVVADHLVHARGRRVGARDDAQDLRLRVGDELRDVRAGREGHRGECSRAISNVRGRSSAFAAHAAVRAPTMRCTVTGCPHLADTSPRRSCCRASTTVRPIAS